MGKKVDGVKETVALKTGFTNGTATLSADGKTMTVVLTIPTHGQRSKTGKSEVMASTHGNVPIGDLRLGLNLYRLTSK